MSEPIEIQEQGSYDSIMLLADGSVVLSAPRDGPPLVFHFEAGQWQKVYGYVVDTPGPGNGYNYAVSKI